MSPNRLLASFLVMTTVTGTWLAGGGVALAQVEESRIAGAPWTEKAADDLSAALGRGRRHAIDTSRLLASLRSASPEQRETTLTRVATTYAEALAYGAVDPAKVSDIFGLERSKADIEGGLSQALASNRLGAWLDSLAPQDAEYQALSRAYLSYLDRAPTPDVEDGPLIRPNDQDPRIPQITRALARLGYVAGDAGPPRAYTPSLVEAVRRFQDNSGLVVDGVIGPGTLAMINKGPADRARQLAVNLERRRWLSRNPPDERIDVNLASGQLTYLHAGKVVWTSRVVAGAPGSATPLLQETFDRLIVNPPWNVPESIAQREILPKGPAYLQAHDMFVQEGRVVQRPGPDAALGQVKFDMQNRYAIYLHDTPAKALFERQERFFSHGCVRVENAVEFAQLLAGESGKAAEFDAALASGATRVVSLGRKIPVRLLYRTAFVDGDGEIAFRLDPYGLDNKVAEALGLGGNGRAVSISPELDLGP